MKSIMRGTKVNWRGKKLKLPYIVREDDEIFIHEVIVKEPESIVMHIAANLDGIDYFCLHQRCFYPSSWIKENSSPMIRDRCIEVENAALKDGYLPFSDSDYQEIVENCR